MDPIENQNPNINPAPPPVSNIQQAPPESGFKKYLKPKFIIIALIILIALLSPLIFFSLRSDETASEIPKESNQQEIVLPPAQNSVNSWSMEVKFDPSDSSYSVEKMTLLNEEFVADQNNSNSPYTLKILNGKKEVIASMKVSIATRFIVPDIIKNSTLSAEFENAPLTSVIKIPNEPEGQTIIIENNNAEEIINVSFPSDIQAMVNSLRSNTQIANTQNAVGIFQSTENVSPAGWKLKVTPLCEDGKAYAKYDYEIPNFSGVIFTYDWTPRLETLDYLDDSSWQKPVGSIILLTGKGTYTAKGNLVNWSPSMGQFVYNGPVGLKKENPYMGKLLLSGDWTCNGDTSRGGCVDGPPPSEKDIADATVSVEFNTSGLQCDTSTGTTPTPVKNDAVQCVPDLECSSGKKVLQICPLICS